MIGSQIKQLNKKIDAILKLRKLPNFPIYGSASGGGSCRNLSQKESEILRSRGAAVPIKVNLSQEKEFSSYLKNEV